MKKPFRHDEVDENRPCIDCHQPLKKNLLARNPKAERCDTCYKLKTNAGNISKSKLRERQEKRRNGGQSV